MRIEPIVILAVVALSGCGTVRVGQHYGDGWQLVGNAAPVGASCSQFQVSPKPGEEPDLIKWAKGAQGGSARAYEYRRVDVYRDGRWERCHFEWQASSEAGSRSVGSSYYPRDYHYSPGPWSRW